MHALIRDQYILLSVAVPVDGSTRQASEHRLAGRHVADLLKRRSVSMLFPYVCREPVLANDRLKIEKPLSHLATRPVATFLGGDFKESGQGDFKERSGIDSYLVTRPVGCEQPLLYGSLLFIRTEAMESC